MFQRSVAPNWSTPFTFLRNAPGMTNCPHGTYSTSSYASSCTFSAIALRLPASGSRAKSARSFSMGSLVGQPNHALSPLPVSTDEVTGVMVSNDVDHVWKMFQPPWGGASFFARRATIVDQSMACRSTVAPSERNTSLVTSAAPCAYG